MDRGHQPNTASEQSEESVSKKGTKRENMQDSHTQKQLGRGTKVPCDAEPRENNR